MRTIIAGSRTFGPRREEVLAAINKLAFSLGKPISEVVSGGAAGVDSIGEEWASSSFVSLPVRRFPADWHTHGKAAGPIRNRLMAANADALILVWDGASRGSADMRRVAIEAGLTVVEQILAPLPVVPMSWSELRAKAGAR